MSEPDEYPVVTDNGGTNVHPGTTLSLITWKVTTTARSSWRRSKGKTEFTLSQKVAEKLADRDIVFVEDLEGMEEDDLKEIPGIGTKTAERLIMAADRAGVRYRGVGFPYEIDTRIRVPTEDAEILEEFSEEEVEEALTGLLEYSDLGQMLRDRILKMRRQEVQAQMEAAREELEKIDSELNGDS